MIQPCLHRILLVGVLFAYLVLALPLPMVLLDHELGLLTGDSTHSMYDDHAWLDHAVGDGLSSGDAIPAALSAVILIVPLCETVHQSCEHTVPSVRGPPPLLS
ncbi:MAG: hypothetical protein HP495_18560 [Nitrospira sp.]|nr:hypothetical protein [Nitrospira sp.]